MNLQQACEVLEDLLERDLVKDGELLNNKEFTAINKVLLELETKGLYDSRVTE